MARTRGDAPRQSPWAMPWAEWKAVLKRVWSELGDDDVGLIAAGAAFYAFLAIVPALGAVVLLYGLLAEPETVREHIGKLFELLPRDAARAIADQLAMVVDGSAAKQGFGLILALGLAIYGASKATVAIRTALNIAYGLKEHRSYVRLQALAIGMVVGGMALILLALATNAVLAWISAAIDSPAVELLSKLLGYLILGAVVLTGAACLYRFGPNHAAPRWTWLSPGALLASLLWLSGTAGFGIYASHLGNYGATYGSLSAVVVLLTWLWLSAYVFLLGAELNSELECQLKAKPESEVPPAMLSAPPSPALLPGAATRAPAGPRSALGKGVALGAGMAWLFWITRRRS